MLRGHRPQRWRSAVPRIGRRRRPSGGGDLPQRGQPVPAPRAQSSPLRLQALKRDGPFDSLSCRESGVSLPAGQPRDEGMQHRPRACQPPSHPLRLASAQCSMVQRRSGDGDRERAERILLCVVRAQKTYMYAPSVSRGARRPFGNAHRGVGFRRGGLSVSGLLTRVLVGFLRRSAHALTEPRRSACDGPCGRRWPAASLLTFPCIPRCSRVPSCSLLRGAAVRRRCS